MGCRGSHQGNDHPLVRGHTWWPATSVSAKVDSLSELQQPAPLTAVVTQFGRRRRLLRHSQQQAIARTSLRHSYATTARASMSGGQVTSCVNRQPRRSGERLLGHDLHERSQQQRKPKITSMASTWIQREACRFAWIAAISNRRAELLLQNTTSGCICVSQKQVTR
jgi:hypothetical protein